MNINDWAGCTRKDFINMITMVRDEVDKLRQFFAEHTEEMNAIPGLCNIVELLLMQSSCADLIRKIGNRYSSEEN